MYVQPMYVDDLQVEECAELHQRQKAELRNMLVIDRVELVAVEQILGPRHFDDEVSVFGQPSLHATHEIMQVADVVEGVGRHDHRSRAVFVDQNLGSVLGEIADIDVDAARLGDFREVCGRIDADRLAAQLIAGREKQAVIAADVDDQAGLSPVLQNLGEPAKVRMHQSRARRHIEIVLEKAFRHLVLDLDQPAFQANLGVECINRLLLADVARTHETVCRRMIAHREEQVRMLGEAGTATCHQGHCQIPIVAGVASGRTGIVFVGRAVANPFAKSRNESWIWSSCSAIRP